MLEDLHYNYLNLSEALEKFYLSGVDNLDITLIVSLEKEYYMGESLKTIMTDLKKFSENKQIKYKDKIFRINKLTLFVADTLNRHMIYYRHCVDYLKQHNLSEEDEIPLEVRNEFQRISFDEGTQEGKDWFKNNIDAFNLFSDEKVITKDFVIGDDVTTIFEETEITPKLEYLCYKHFYDDPEYETVEKKLNKAMELSNGLIERCYKYEADRFYIRLTGRGMIVDFKDLFIQQSMKYLIDETMPSIMRDIPGNNLDIYYYGHIPDHFKIYSARSVKNNKKLMEFVQENLREARDYIRITLREKC